MMSILPKRRHDRNALGQFYSHGIYTNRLRFLADPVMTAEINTFATKLRLSRPETIRLLIQWGLDSAKTPLPR